VGGNEVLVISNLDAAFSQTHMRVLMEQLDYVPAEPAHICNVQHRSIS
jgi:hypothetical protein